MNFKSPILILWFEHHTALHIVIVKRSTLKMQYWKCLKMFYFYQGKQSAMQCKLNIEIQNSSSIVSVHCREEGCITRIWGGCKVVSRPLDYLCYWYLDVCDDHHSTQITEKQGKAMYKVQSNWGHCLCNLFYKKILSLGMIYPENFLAGGVSNWNCNPCRSYLSISSCEYL